MIQIDLWWFVGLIGLAYACGIFTAVGDLFLWNKPTGVAQPTAFRWPGATRWRQLTQTNKEK